MSLPCEKILYLCGSFRDAGVQGGLACGRLSQGASMHSREKKVKQSVPIHYGWVIALTGMGVLFACLGLGRFSLGMLLPSMGASLDLTYSQMGLIGTGNFVGYMLSIVLAGMTARVLGARKTIVLGLLLVGCSMMLISRAQGFITAMALFTATGMGSGLANVPMMGLVSHWFLKSTRGRAAGAMLSGNGLAIVLTGFFIPWINQALGAEGWRTGWLTIGTTALVIAAIAGLLLRNHPEEKGLAPLGKAADTPGTAGPEQARDTRGSMIHLGCIYIFFGATYAVYVTFIVTALVNERGFGEGAAGGFWSVVGALSMISGPLFGWMSDRLGRKTAIMVVYTLFTIAYALAAADLPIEFLYLSIGIFGLSVWSVPTIMSAAVGDYAGPARAASAFGFITLFFGAGQISGPVLAGILADRTGTFSTAFWLCALLTAIAVGVTAFLKPPGKS